MFSIDSNIVGFNPESVKTCLIKIFVLPHAVRWLSDCDSVFYNNNEKKCFIRRTNPASHLKTSGFDIKLFWSLIPSGIFAGIQNDASKINITQSVIARNTLGKSNNGVFYAQKGTTNVENSAIYDNKLANGNNATLFSGNLITAENNYWGTNSRPDTKVSQWVILTAEAPEYAFVGVGESIPVYLNTYNNTAGETGAITGMPDVTLGVVYTLNTENPATVTISNGQGAIDYAAALDGDETITLSSGDSFSFEVNADVSTLIYVDGSVATSGTGTSESPFKTIAEALNIAADGKIIVVRSGTYTESDLVIDDDIIVEFRHYRTVRLIAQVEIRYHPFALYAQSEHQEGSTPPRAVLALRTVPEYTAVLRRLDDKPQESGILQLAELTLYQRRVHIRRHGLHLRIERIVDNMTV